MANIDGIVTRYRDGQSVKSIARRTLGWEKAGMPKATVRPTLREIAWAAGFIEGEGSFTAGGTRQYRCERVTVAQVNEEPLRRMQQLFGGSIRYRRNNPNGFGGRNCGMVGEWRVNGSRARGLMFTLYPFLSQKRQSQLRDTLMKCERKVG